MKIVVFALLLFASNALFANVCEVKSGEIKLVESGISSTEKNNWIEDCSGTIELVSAQAEICLFNQLKQWHCKVEQKQDGVIQISELEVDPEYATGFFEALRSLFDPETDMEFGGLRLKEGEPLPGFPYSDILLPAQSLELSIARGTSETISRFALLDLELNREIFASNTPGPAVSIPASLLSPGKRYEWNMAAPSKQYSGIFSVLETADQREFDQDFNSAEPEGGLSGAAKELLRAVVAREYGYTFDYQQSLYKARQAITSDSGGVSP